MRLQIIICIIFLVLRSQAQDFNNYKPLRSVGPVPADFTSSSMSKYQSDILNIEKNSNRFERKRKDKFYLESNYYNDIVLRSGRVLFGDPITQYINKVSDYLLEPYAELKQKVRFYTLKSTVVNAYSMNSGIILISTGLIAKLENEVQLAFVIGHELVHFVKKHAIHQYIEAEKIRRGKGDYKKLSWDDKFFAQLSYSREDELVADKEAVSMFLSHSEYDLSYVPGIFDVLAFHHTPFGDIQYDFSNLCPAGHKFYFDYFLGEITPPKPSSGYDESKSTHPETTMRKEIITKLVSEYESEADKTLWSVSETEFYNVRNIARFENVHLYILNEQPADAFYNIFLLQQDFPNSFFLEKAFAYCLYVLSVYKSNLQTNDVVGSHLHSGGYFREILYFFKRINKVELTCISLNQTWKIYRKYPDDKLLKQINERLIEELITKHSLQYSDFQTSLPEYNDSLENIDSTDVIVEVESDNTYIKPKRLWSSQRGEMNPSDSISDEKTDDDESNSKKTSLKSKKYITTFKHNVSYLLTEIMGDSLFAEMYRNVAEFANKNVISEPELSISEKKKIRKQRESEGESLGIDTLLVFEPGFSKIDQTKKDNYHFIDSEKTEFTILSYILNNAEMNDIETTLIDIRLLTESDSVKYNECEVIKEWIHQYYTHEFDFNMLQWNFEEVEKITQKYNTEHIFISYFETIKYRRGNYFQGIVLLAGTGLIMLTPIYTVWYFIPSHFSSFVAAIINIDTGNIEFVSMSEAPIRGNKSWINGILYNCLYQTKRKPE